MSVIVALTMAQKAKATVLQKIEIILNTLNHVAIGAIAIYLTVLCWNLGPTAISLHTWLSAIGVSELICLQRP